MISFAEALQCALDHARVLSTEHVGLAACDGRVLREDVRSDVDMPPFRKSAMDGYACRRADLPGPLQVVDTIPAGRMPSVRIGPGTCSKIMTGAPLPDGADCVVMIEDTEACGADSIRFTRRETSDNFCAQGEDVRTGGVVLRPGTLLTPAAIAVLASVGRAEALVSRQPRVAVVATGSELCATGQRPSGAMIRDSNSPQLAAQIARIGARVTNAGIVVDDSGAIADLLNRLRAEHDLLVVTGGVSSGDFDFVPDVLRHLGFALAFDSVAMQPGRPTVLADDGKTAVCGLPGNPVSTFTICELLLRPFLLAMQGHTHSPRIVVAKLTTAFQRRRGQRQLTVPVRFAAADRVEFLDYHGSAHIHAYTSADAILIVPAGVTTLEAGATVHVRLL